MSKDKDLHSSASWVIRQQIQAIKVDHEPLESLMELHLCFNAC